MKHTERSAEKPSPAIGLFATLRASRCSTGTCAPARPRLALASLCAAALALSAFAAPVSAATPPNFCPPGSAAGQCDEPLGVAVDQSNGTLYVADSGNGRIDEFDSSGNFLRAFGFGVLNGAAELQVCTTVCQAGKSGTAPGEISPGSVAVDNDPSSPSFHDLYVTDHNNFRLEKFTPAGEFLLMFGKGVNTGTSGTPDVCTNAGPPTDVCGAGSSGSGSGQLNGKNENPPVAVDASGDVWVGDFNRLEQFGAEGEFLSEMPVASAGVISGLAIDPASEDLYALNPPVDEMQVITPPPSGSYTLTFEGQTTKSIPSECSLEKCLQELPAIGEDNVIVLGGSTAFFVGSFDGRDVPQLEISAGGSVETTTQGVAAKVSKLSSGGTLLETIDEAGYPKALGLDPASGDLFVSDQIRACLSGQRPASLFAYDSTGAQTESFGTGGVIGCPIGNALAFGASAKRLYVVGSFRGGAQIFALPEEGPLPEENGESAAPVKKTTATLHANVNPEGKETKCEFEYVDEEHFKAGGFSNPATKKTPLSASIGADFSEHACSAAITGLTTETTYHFRVIAHNENAPPGGIFGAGATFTTQPPLRIDATFATEVSSTGATLGAQVNPLGDPASYRFEYLTEAEYEANLEEGSDGFSGAHAPTSVPVPDAVIASSEADLAVSRHVSGLQASTAYRYRIFLTNAATPSGIPGPARVFTTQDPGGSLTLPDHRAWELVSPVDKNGGAVSGIDQGTYLSLVEAATSGGAITYGSPVAFADPAGSPAGNQYLSTRHGEAGWSTANIGIPINAGANLAIVDPPYKAFSSDLSAGLVSSGYPGLEESPALPGTEAAPGNGNFYLRDNVSAGYRAILTEAQAGSEASLPLFYEDASPDLRHLIFSEPFTPPGKANLYEWTEGHIDLLNLLPGKTTPTSTSQGLGNGERQIGAGLRDLHALSADGTRAVWAAATAGSQFDPPHNLYLRQNIGQPQSVLAGSKCTEPEMACTVQIDASEGGVGKGGNGVFLAASVDDSAIFFADHQRLTPDSTADQLKGEHPQRGDLYRFQPGAEAGHRLTDLTVDPTDPGGAEVVGVLGGSDDGSYLYFAANGVLASNPGADGSQASPGNCKAEDGAPDATCNLYLYHEGTTTFIATLDGEDEYLRSDVVSFGAGEPQASGTWQGVANRDARVSPDGTHLLFVSYRALTGYDNLAANGTHCGIGEKGEPLPSACPEVFRFQAPTEVSPAGNLACLSCNPTGQRPIGLSAVPTGTHTSNQEWEGIYQSRALSADGSRAFFDSYDALVPQDTNGRLDVYEWEELGAGTCEESSSTFSQSSGGCVSLISSGTGSESSAFMDASANGSDVFFITGSSLVAQDPGSVDLYDARENGGLPEPPPPPASCQGDACQSPPPAPNDPTPASSTYNGPGNEHPVKKPRHKHQGHKHKKAHHKKHKREGPR